MSDFAEEVQQKMQDLRKYIGEYDFGYDELGPAKVQSKIETKTGPRPSKKIEIKITWKSLTKKEQAQMRKVKEAKAKFIEELDKKMTKK